MLGWLKRRREVREAKRRKIFRYWDGVRWRYADPLEIARKLDEDAEYNPATTPRMMAAGDMEAFYIALRATRRVFGVAEWSDGQPGLTMEETAMLLESYFEFTDVLKKNIEHSAISQSSTEPGILPNWQGETTKDSAPSGTPDTVAHSSP